MLKSKALPTLGALAVILLASSCTLSRPSQEARVEIAFAPRDSGSDGLWSRLTRSLSRSPVRTDAEWLTLPDSWQEFDCLGLHVSGSGISAETSALPSRSVCSGGTVSLAEPGLIGGLISTAIGGSISLAIPLGGSRKVQLFGLKTRDGSCPAASSLFSSLGERNLGATHLDGAGDAAAADWPMVLASTTVELTQDTTLSLTPAFVRSTPEPVFCDGSGTEVSITASVSNVSLDGVPLADLAADPGAHESIFDDDELVEEYTFVIELDRRLMTELVPANFSLPNSPSTASISAVNRLSDFSYSVTVESSFNLDQSGEDTAGTVTLALRSGQVRDTYGRLLNGFDQNMDQAITAYLATLGLSVSDIEGNDGSGSGSGSTGLPNFGGYSIDAAGEQVYGPNSAIYALGPCSGGVERLTITQSDGNTTSTYGPFPCPSASAFNSYSDGYNTSPLSSFTTGIIFLKMDGWTNAGEHVTSATEVFDYDKTPPSLEVLQADYSAGVFRLRIQPDDVDDIQSLGVTVKDHLGALFASSNYNNSQLLSALTASGATLDISLPAPTAMGGSYILTATDYLGNSSQYGETSFDIPARPSLSVALGDGFSCFVTETGGISHVRCAGDDSHGQLGRGAAPGAAPVTYTALTSVDFPAYAANLSEVKRVSGSRHTCVWVYDSTTASEQIQCWGDNSKGQLGYDPTISNSSATPVQVSSLPTDLVDVVAADNTTCALGANSQVYCWGDNSKGQLGAGNSFPMVGASIVKHINSGFTLTGVTTLTAGGRHFCGAGSNIPTSATGVPPPTAAQVVCWGDNASLQLGQSSVTLTSGLAVAIPGLAGAAELKAGDAFTCARSSGGAVYCWGDNTYGQIGNPSVTTTRTSTPTQESTLNTFGELTAGKFFACAKTSTGTHVACWGRGTLGQIGDGTLISKNQPTLVSLSLGGGTLVTSIAAGNNHACARLTDSTIRCWGEARKGQLGVGSTYIYSLPTPQAVNLGALTGTYIGFSAFGDSTGVKTTTGLYAWGSNSGHGPIRARVTSQPLSSAQAVSGIPAGQIISHITAGEAFACALTQVGAAYCWGANTLGQLGTGLIGDSSTATLVDGLGSGVVSISAAGQGACATLVSGLVKCWGNNATGNLGNVTKPPIGNPVSALPVEVTLQAGTPFPNVLGTSVSASGACAVTNSGSVSCWGSHPSGTDLAYAEPWIPNGVAQTSLGNGRGCALIASSATVQCWGDNTAGAAVPEMSSPTIPSPSTLSGLTHVKQISLGVNHSCALADDGSGPELYCWGLNSAGELGDAAGSSPSSALNSSNWTNQATGVVAGYNDSCAMLPTPGDFECSGVNFDPIPGDVSP